MLTTEAKARQNWCPMVRIARREVFEVRRPAVGGMEVVHEEQFIPGGCNRDALGGYGAAGVPLNSCKCYASACMMWRWDTDGINSLQRKRIETGVTERVDEPPRPESMPASWEWCPYDPSDGGGACWVEPEADMLARRVGYCGLAGMPLELAKLAAEAGR